MARRIFTTPVGCLRRKGAQLTGIEADVDLKCYLVPRGSKPLAPPNSFSLHGPRRIRDIVVCSMCAFARQASAGGIAGKLQVLCC